jgi:hypothetical protein
MDLNFIRGDDISSLPLEDYNEEIVRRVVNKTDNPHPALILVICLTTILVIYIIYVLFIKTTFAGHWYTNNGKIKLNHNKFTDTVSISMFIKPASTKFSYKNGTGYVNGGAIYIDDNKGIMVDHKIHWVNSSDVWSRKSFIVS